MPTTFNVISLGNSFTMDPLEGNNSAEWARFLEGSSYGGPGNSLIDNFVEFSAVSYSGGQSDVYDQNNANSNDTFRIDGGPVRTFDSSVVFEATVTYMNGDTATVTAVIFQDTGGDLFWAPEFTQNADQDAIEWDQIQSLTLDSLVSNNFSGMTANRESWDFMPCFVHGTRIATAEGHRAIEHLQVGDLVKTADRGMQPIRWIGRAARPAEGRFAPIRIGSGALGNRRALLLSPQHRVLITGWRAELYCGTPEVLVPACKLVDGSEVRIETGGSVYYYHLLFDHHEVIRAEGLATESFLPGAQSWAGFDEGTREEIVALFPELDCGSFRAYGPAARPMPRPYLGQLLAG